MFLFSPFWKRQPKALQIFIQFKNLEECFTFLDALRNFIFLLCGLTRGGQYGSCGIPWDNDHSVGVTDNNIPRVDRDACAGDRHINRPWRRLESGHGRNRASKNREPGLDDCLAIANSSIKNYSADSFLFGHLSHQVAPESCV